MFSTFAMEQPLREGPSLERYGLQMVAGRSKMPYDTGRQISDLVLRHRISCNAQQVEKGRQEARESRFKQWAVKDEEFAS